MPEKFKSASLLLLALPILSLLFHSCTQRHYSYGFVSIPAVSSDGKYIATLVAETEVTTRQENGGYRSSSNNSSYWLKVYELSSGKLMKKKKVAENAEKQNLTAISYGGYGDNIWLNTNKLVVYNIKTLEKVTDEEAISKQNNLDPFNFPIDQRFIDEMLSDGFMLYRGMDGKQYKIDAGNFKITALDKLTPELISTLNKKNMEETKQSGIRGFRSDTIGKNMFDLTKDSSAALDSHPGYDNTDDIFRPLHLYKSEYSVTQIGSYRSYKKTNLVQLSGNTYYNGRFAKDYTNGQLIRVNNGNGYLIISFEKPTNETNTILSSVTHDNKTNWQTNTGLSSRINHCFSTNRHCILTGNKHYIISPVVGSDFISIVDLKNGKLVKLLPDE